MRKQGRKPEPLTKEQLEAVQEYLNSDKTYEEVAEEYGVKAVSLKYWVKKYRKGIVND